MPKKNLELLRRLRTRFLRMRHKKRFYMNDVIRRTPCGTAMCIAGHALDLEGYKAKLNNRDEFEWFAPNGKQVEPLDEAQKLLGLSTKEAQYADGINSNNSLFYRFDLKTPKQAAKVIERLISDNEPARLAGTQ